MECNVLKLKILSYINSQIYKEYLKLLEDKNMYGLINYIKLFKQQFLSSQNNQAVEEGKTRISH